MILLSPSRATHLDFSRFLILMDMTIQNHFIIAVIILIGIVFNVYRCTIAIPIILSGSIILNTISVRLILQWCFSGNERWQNRVLLLATRIYLCRVRLGRILWDRNKRLVWSRPNFGNQMLARWRADAAALVSCTKTNSATHC